MFDLCTPIIYGSPKVAGYHRKALGLETQFSTVERAEDARDGRLNLLATFDEEVKVELGTPTEESDSAARKAVARAKEDLQKGLYDVLVQAPMKSNAIEPISSPRGGRCHSSCPGRHRCRRSRSRPMRTSFPLPGLPRSGSAVRRRRIQRARRLRAR